MKLLIWGSPLILLALLVLAFALIRIDRTPAVEDWITPRL
jgi:hypothetical protein